MTSPDYEIIAGMATCPGRQNGLSTTINSLLPQIDQLHIYFNHFPNPPNECPTNPKIIPHCDSPNLGDAGKFYYLFRSSTAEKLTYFFSVDDDIIYPTDYVEKMVQKLKQYQNQAVVTAHGKVIKHPPIQNYYSNHQKISYYDCRQEIKKDVPVHISGTGVTAFPLSLFSNLLSQEDFPKPNMADIWFSLKCQQLKIPQLVMAHPANWIKLNPKIPVQITIAYRNQHASKQKDLLDLVNQHSWNLLS